MLKNAESVCGGGHLLELLLGGGQTRVVLSCRPLALRLAESRTCSLVHAGGRSHTRVLAEGELNVTLRRALRHKDIPKLVGLTWIVCSSNISLDLLLCHGAASRICHQFGLLLASLKLLSHLGIAVRHTRDLDIGLPQSFKLLFQGLLLDLGIGLGYT